MTITAPALPLFYRSPMLIRAPEHLTFGVKPSETPFSFAAEATAIPIVANEFAVAGRHYPIVFANERRACRWS